MSYGSGFPYGSIEPYGSISGDIVFYTTLSGVANAYGSFTTLQQATANLTTTITSALLSTSAVKGYYYPPQAALSYGDSEPYGGIFKPTRYVVAQLSTASLRQAYTARETSTASLRATYTARETSTANLRKTYTASQRSTAALITSVIYQACLTSTANLRAVFQAETKTTANHYQQFVNSQQAITRGIYVYQAQQTGAARLAQAGMDAYLLYRGIDTQPDFTAEPWQVFTTPPFTTPVLDSGHSYQLVLRKRNQYGIISQNKTVWTVTPDNPAIHPSAPTDIVISAAAGGKVTVTALYDWRTDDINAATDFLIYLTSNSVEPNPATDTPTLVTVWQGGAFATLNWLSPALTDGATVKVLVRTQRNTTQSTNTTSVTTTATSTHNATVKGVIIDAPNLGNNIGF